MTPIMWTLAVHGRCDLVVAVSYSSSHYYNYRSRSSCEQWLRCWLLPLPPIASCTVAVHYNWLLPGTTVRPLVGSADSARLRSHWLATWPAGVASLYKLLWELLLLLPLLLRSGIQVVAAAAVAAVTAAVLMSIRRRKGISL